MIFVNNVAAMVLLAANVGDIIETHGYYYPGDGGGNRYIIIEKGTVKHNGGSYIDLNNSKQAKGFFKGKGYNVRQFGAKGDNNSDDTIPIQNTINALGSTGTVFFSKGTYLYSTIKVNSHNITIEGAGFDTVLIKNTPTGDGIVFDIKDSIIYSNKIINLALSASVPQESGTLLVFKKQGQFEIYGIKVTKWPHNMPAYRGILVENSSQGYMDKIQVTGCLDDGVSFLTTNDMYVAMSRSDANKGNGWVVNNAAGHYMTQTTAYGNKKSAFKVFNNNLYHIYTACVGDSSGSHNWDVSELKSSTFTASWGSYQAEPGNFCGLLLHDSKDVSLNNFIAINNKGDGVRLTGTSTGINITGGQFNNNKAYGIHLANTGTVSISSANTPEVHNDGNADLEGE